MHTAISLSYGFNVPFNITPFNIYSNFRIGKISYISKRAITFGFELV